MIKTEEVENKKEMLHKKKRKYFIAGVLLVTVATVCLATGCFHSPDISVSKNTTTTYDDNQSHPKPKPPLPDSEKFIKSWNSDIVRLSIRQIKNSNYKIDFSKYKIKKDPQKALGAFLAKDESKLKNIKQQLVSHKDKAYFKPLIIWIDKKLEMKHYAPLKPMNSKELWKYVAGIVNPHKSYSPNTTYKIIELNNFCYFFDKYKNDFYQEGYDRYMKSCEQVQKILDEDGIDFHLK